MEINLNILDGELEKYKDALKEIVVKDNIAKKSFRIYRLTRKLITPVYAKLSYCFKEKGIYFSKKINGFIIEELEYKPEDKISMNDKKLSMKEMQEQFLKNNKVKKLEDGGAELSYIERKSVSHRSSHFLETEFEALYDGLEMYDKNNNKVVITFHSRAYGVVYGTTKRTKITYYNISRWALNGVKIKKKYKQCTIKKWINEGLLTKEPKKL